jgi:hypothetical protein
MATAEQAQIEALRFAIVMLENPPRCIPGSRMARKKVRAHGAALRPLLARLEAEEIERVMHP